MAPTFNFIQPPPNSTGLKIDTAELTNGANTVERQVISLGDPSTAANVANVVAGTQPTQYYSAVAASLLDGYKATYGASAVGVSFGTGATTDCVTIFGSASKTIRVLRLRISSTTATAAAYYDLLLQVCSAAPASGAATTLTDVPFDANDAAGTAVAKVWTTAPTAASYVGKIAAVKYFSALTGTAAPVTNIEWDWGSNPGRAIVLRGVAQGLSLSLNGATPANAQSWDVEIVWTEE